MRRRIISLMLAVAVVLSLVPCAYAQESVDVDTLVKAVRDAYVANETQESLQTARESMQVTSMETVEVPMYLITSAEEEIAEITLFNGNDAVAYMEIGEMMEEFQDLLLEVFQSKIVGYYGDRSYVMLRDNGEYAIVDFYNGSVVFSDYDLFLRSYSAINGGDLLETDT